LQQSALQQHQRLPPELSNQLPQVQAEVLVAVDLVVQGSPLFLIGEVLLEAAQDVGIGELPLGEPGGRDHAQLFPQHAKELRRISHDDDGLLHRRTCHVRRPVEKLGGVHLPGARDAEQGRSRARRGSGLEEGKVREVLGGSAEYRHTGHFSSRPPAGNDAVLHHVDVRVRPIAQSHEGKQRPVILDGRVRALGYAKPPLDFGSFAQVTTLAKASSGP